MEKEEIVEIFNDLLRDISDETSSSKSETEHTEELFYLKHECESYMRNRFMSREKFREALEVYWNNQDYYLERDMIEELKGLEIWFMHVIEPINDPFNKEDVSEWIKKENIKSEFRTNYCSLEASKKLKLTRKDISLAHMDLECSRVLAEEYKKRKKKS